MRKLKKKCETNIYINIHWKTLKTTKQQQQQQANKPKANKQTEDWTEKKLKKEGISCNVLQIHQKLQAK